VRPSTSEPRKRVDGDEDMTIFFTPAALHASITLSVPRWLTLLYRALGWNGPTAAALCHTQSAPWTSSRTAAASQISPTRHSIFEYRHAFSGGGTMSKLITFRRHGATKMHSVYL